MPFLAPCNACEGTGLINGETCFLCGGSGTLMQSGILAHVSAKLQAQPTGVKLVYTHKIVAVIDAAEYAALADASKDGLRMIMSCGVVDLDHAGQIYANLMAIFGSSPITKAAIEAL
jgi:dUTPase